MSPSVCSSCGCVCTASPTCPGPRWRHTCALSWGSPSPIPIWGDHCPAGTTAQCSEAAPGQGSASTGSWGVWPGAVPPHGSAAGAGTAGPLHTTMSWRRSDRGCRWPLVPGEVARLPQPCCMTAPASPGQSPTRVPTGPVSPGPRAALPAQSHSPGWAWGKKGCVPRSGDALHSQLPKALAGVSPHLSPVPTPHSCPRCMNWGGNWQESLDEAGRIHLWAPRSHNPVPPKLGRDPGVQG